LKFFKSLFLPLVIAGALYLILAPALQTLLLARLEEGSELKFSGRNLNPFSLFSIPYENLEITLKDHPFSLKAKRAVFFFSPFETLLGTIPLRIKASNLQVISEDPAMNLLVSGMKVDTLESRLQIFCGKGVEVRSLELKGKDLTLQAKGRVMKRGRAGSDLAISLTAGRDSFWGGMKFLTENLFSKKKESTAQEGPVNFKFHLKGDIARPEISLESDLVSLNISEQPEAV
jgi:hypothetical protein